MVQKKRPPVAIWAPYINAFLGIWLINAPFLCNYTGGARYSDLISGVLLIFLAWKQRSHTRAWVSWSISILGGIWLQAAPLLFWGNAACYFNDSFVGIFAVLFSIVIAPIPNQMQDEGPSIPPGWSYNPSSWGQRIPIAFFAFAGWIASRYLAAYQMGHIDTIWEPLFADGTHKVLTSEVSKAFPVSDAGLGSMAYILEALLTCQGGERRWRTSPWMVLLFGVLVVPLSLISIVLVILQPLAVGAWCSLCLITALCMLFPIALGVDEVVATLQYLKHTKEEIPFWKIFFQGGLCPGSTMDERSPTPESSLKQLLISSWWGVTIPWNLGVSSLVGLALMFPPFEISPSMQDAAAILGPLIIVTSVISWSETIRKARWGNCLFAIALIGAAFFFEFPISGARFFSYALVGIAIFLLSLRRGPIREKTQYRVTI